MVTLQPYIDDSGSEPQSHTFVLGGLIAEPAEWLAFSADWQKALESGPVKLDYFKMSEAMSLMGQFYREGLSLCVRGPYLWWRGGPGRCRT